MISEKKRVCVAGGSFDPPTYFHIQSIIEIYNTNLADEIWFVPAGDREDKPNLTKRIHRYNMLKLIIQDMNLDELGIIRVDDIEIENGKQIKTYNLMKTFEQKYPDIDFYFTIGTDLIDTLDTWYEAAKLKKEIKFIINPREGYSYQEKNLPENYIIRKTYISFLGSSTEVRRRIMAIRQEKDPFTSKKLNENLSSENENTRLRNDIITRFFSLLGLTSKSVIKYIHENMLYFDNKL